MKLRKGDKVKVITGKDKGKEGVIEKVYKKTNRIVIPGTNIYKRHVKKNENLPQGGIVDVPRPMTVAKVMYLCPKCGKKTRLGWKIEKNKKTRVCKKCESLV